ncbi:hypothetical protein HN992_02580 [Candidatus Woesearchaeota archaeon]|nr:hypothetical protein [Candidatus Woesearchaeota archaeon]MBT3438686.1 hypothetical protein [Candidatus Woesearchaeota archaeon]MBT4058079.1 hypothetical protein [Candidatus Woesearchaeota archaeon]MBT4730385.1 hypothetical protein [Candidatus Woesearchaeota archaeon]MBT5043009.1 hypothetical protein [Candidatus Woesearchaeota archaeon]
MIDSEFDKQVRAYSSWRNNKNSQNNYPIQETYFDGISCVADAMRSLGNPYGSKPLTGIPTVNNPLSLDYLTEGQKAMVHIGSILTDTTDFLENIINGDISELETNQEEITKSKNVIEDILDKIRTAYMEAI